MPSDEADTFLNFLSQLMKAKRLELGLSQDQLANTSGIDRATISRWEAKERVPSIMALYDMAQAMDSPLHELVKTASDQINRELDSANRQQ